MKKSKILNFNRNISYLFSLLLNTETWSKDVCDLIDYDNDKLIINSLNIKSTAYVYRKSNEVISSSERLNKEDQELL